MLASDATVPKRACNSRHQNGRRFLEAQVEEQQLELKFCRGDSGRYFLEPKHREKGCANARAMRSEIGWDRKCHQARDDRHAKWQVGRCICKHGWGNALRGLGKAIGQVFGVVRLLAWATRLATESPGRFWDSRSCSLAVLSYVFLLQCSCHDHPHGRSGTGAGDV